MAPSTESWRRATQRVPSPPQALRAVHSIVSHDANASFPSGDVAGAVAFAYSLGSCAGMPYAGLACVLLSCFGRLYWHTHHLLDVACGAAVAAAACAALELVSRPLLLQLLLLLLPLLS